MEITPLNKYIVIDSSWTYEQIKLLLLDKQFCKNAQFVCHPTMTILAHVKHQDTNYAILDIETKEIKLVEKV